MEKNKLKSFIKEVKIELKNNYLLKKENKFKKIDKINNKNKNNKIKYYQYVFHK